MFCNSPHVIKIGGTCTAHGEIGNALQILLGTPEGKKSRGRPGHRWEDNIIINLKRYRM
jgi:hypothetical protein